MKTERTKISIYRQTLALGGPITLKNSENPEKNSIHLKVMFSAEIT